MLEVLLGDGASRLPAFVEAVGCNVGGREGEREGKDAFFGYLLLDTRSSERHNDEVAENRYGNEGGHGTSCCALVGE